MFAIPSLGDCVTRARSAFRAYLPGTDAWLWPNNIGPTAKVIGGSQWELFNRLDYVQRAKFALTAEGSDLDDHGSEINVLRKTALSASGNVVVTATDAIAIAAGATFQRLDGALFAASAAAANASAGSVSVPVVAVSPALSGNTQAGTSLTILSGVTGVGAASATAAVDTSGIAGGLDVEPDGPPFTSDLSTYRGRILFRKRNPLQGGAPADYVSWALAVPGVTRVFVERLWAGPGTVRVFPIFDQLFAAAGGVADVGHIAAVANALAPLQPAAASVTVAAPTPHVINVGISSLSPGTTAARSAVDTELASEFVQLGRVAGSDTGLGGMPFLATPYSFPLIWISGAIKDAPGAVSADLNSPGGDTALATGEIPVLGTVAFT